LAVSISMTPSLALHPNPELRSKLLDYFIENYTSQELSDWLRDLGQDPKGTVAEKKVRVRQHTKYLSMAAEEFPHQTMHHLDIFPSGHLADICEALGIDAEGTKDACYRRIMREVGYREGWLSGLKSVSDATFTVLTVKPFIQWYPVIKRGKYEKDFYPAFEEEMKEIFGPDFVHRDLPIASGTTLKIDFHLGHPQREGVGVEFKMPTNNSEIQRALGQLDQYKERYGDRLLIVLFPDFLNEAQKTLFVDQLSAKGVTIVVK